MIEVQGNPKFQGPNAPVPFYALKLEFCTFNLSHFLPVYD